MLGQAAVCCGNNVGLNFDGGLQIGDSVADVKVLGGMPRFSGGSAKPGGGLIQQIENAIQAAIHPDSALTSSVDISRSPGGEVIPFPVVSPYRPLTATRAPVAGLTAFPKSGYYFNGEPNIDFNSPETGESDEDEQVPAGHESLGFIDPAAGMTSGVSLPYSQSFGPQQPSGPSRLQSILGAISTTLPATISAFKSQPYYNPAQGAYPQSAYPQGVYATQAGPTGGGVADIGAQAGAAVGGLGDTVGKIVADHPYIVLAAGAAVLLMFMKPPGRRGR